MTRFGRLLVLSQAALLALSTGCRSRGDLVEAELRTRERELREVRAELQRAELVNQAMQQELEAIRAVPLARPVPVPAAAAPVAAVGLKEVAIGRGTGGLDEDRLPGDEALLVVVVPRDEDGQPLRALGSVTVTAREVSPEGVKFPLGTWEVSALALRPLWRSGLLSTGYYIKLGWKKPPGFERLRIEVQFVLPDGRVFETDRDVTVRVLPGTVPGVAPVPPVTAPGVPGAPARPLEVLPPPMGQGRAGDEKAPLARSVRLLPPRGAGEGGLRH